jgi:inner membrane protein
MDNLCHTLVGWGMGEAGLKQKTRYGNATLMIAANLPDIDVLVFFTRTPSVEFRRGWTHGLAAQVVLPLLLTAAVVACDRMRRWWRPLSGRPASAESPQPLSIPWLLALAYAGVYSHVALDFLNNYGVRLLAPFDWRWFYGDALFIADVWLWLALGAGVWLSRRRRSPVPARGALAFAVCYAAAMLLSAQAARGVVREAWRQLRGSEPRALMVGPLPLTPFTRAIIVDAGDHYETGRFSWWPPGVTFDPQVVRKGDSGAAVAAARRTRLIRAYLMWARFPYWTVRPAATGVQVGAGDVRFGDALGGRMAASVVVPAGQAPDAPP